MRKEVELRTADGRRFPPLLKIGAFPEAVEAKIRSVFDLIELDALDESLGLQNSIAGIVTRSNYRVSADLIDRLPNLRIITTNGVGYDGIPVDYAAKRGIVVTNTPDVLNKAVAELAIGLLLSLLRDLPAADQFVRSGAWQKLPFALGANLAGKKVGIAGLGGIGKEIAKRLVPFDVELGYYGRQRQAVPWRYCQTIEALATYADVLIVCCPGGAATYHLIDLTVLKALGPEGVVVNISRGSVVNEDDLCKALSQGLIRGASLDVFKEEPLGESPLRSLPNVVLTPHIGSATRETRLHMAELAMSNLIQFFETGKAVTPVSV